MTLCTHHGIQCIIFHELLSHTVRVKTHWLYVKSCAVVFCSFTTRQKLATVEVPTWQTPFHLQILYVPVLRCVSYQCSLPRCWMMWSMVGLKREFIASGFILSIPWDDHLTKSTLERRGREDRKWNRVHVQLGLGDMIKMEEHFRWLYQLGTQEMRTMMVSLAS